MPNYTLYYFNGRGRAEILRMMFAAAAVQYTDKRFEFSEWDKIKKGIFFLQIATNCVCMCRSCVQDIKQLFLKKFRYMVLLRNGSMMPLPIQVNTWLKFRVFLLLGRLPYHGLSYNLPIARGILVGYIPLPIILVLCEMQQKKPAISKHGSCQSF